MHIKKGDTVVVVAGDDRDKRGTVLSVDRKNKRVVVAGVNRVYKHVRRGHPKSPQGGRLNLELPINISNVMLVCPETNEPTRVGIRLLADGSKERYSKRSKKAKGSVAAAVSMGQVSPPRAGGTSGS